WYVLPDEFLVSGESLVRNLLEGRRTAAAFGTAMSVGYVPDQFGHIAQLPQIVRGFGIDSAVLWRGVGSSVTRDQADWAAPDGTTVLLHHLSGGYANAAVLPSSPDSLMEKLAQIRSRLEPRAVGEYLLLMNGNDHMLPQADVPTIIAEANRRMKDAEIIHGTLPMVIDAIRSQISADGAELQRVEGELRSPELAHLLAGVLSARTNIKQRNARCELLLERWAEPFSTFAGLIGRSAERGGKPPSGVDREAQPLLRLAWRQLLKNQPHDSICGCSIDQVHREMETRFDECEQIARLTMDRALEALSEAADTESFLAGSPSTGAVAVFNSETGPRTDFVTATIDLPGDRSGLSLIAPRGEAVPWQILREHRSDLASANLQRGEVQGYLRLSGPGKDWPRWKLKMLEKVTRAAMRGRMPDLVVASMDVVPGSDPTTANIEIEVGAGREHNWEVLSAGMRQLTNLVERGDAQHFKLRVRRRDQVEIGFAAPQTPGMGMQLLKFERSKPPVVAPVHAHEATTLENEFLSLQVSPEDGTARLIDRETGTIYWGLNQFVDEGEGGDEYTYSPPRENRFVTSPATPPTVVMEESGPARYLVRVEMEYQLPVSLSEDRSRRAEETVACRIVSRLSLYPGVPRVDVHTTIDNRARDHRLRVLFPTHGAVGSSHADGQYAVIERPVEAPDHGGRWLEHPTGTHPQMCWVDINDGETGLMIANRGLREYEILRQDGKTSIAITLLRCVGWLSRDDLSTRQGAAGPVVETPGAQMQGVHSFEYSVIPHSGSWSAAMEQGYWFARPMAALWTGRHQGKLGPSLSFLSLSPRSVLISAVKRAEDGTGDVIVRANNNLGEPASSSLKALFPVAAAFRTNLAEEPGQPIAIDPDGTIRFTAAPRQIVTIRLKPGGDGRST
ncbi:MAG TPA: glycoside hydrolase family 38 C-terminal domain-containing protein, partial [Bacteroidota bacterium]